MCQTNSSQTDKTKVINFMGNEKNPLPEKEVCKNCESCSKNTQKESEKEK